MAERGEREIVFKAPDIEGGSLKLEKDKKDIQDFDEYIDRSIIVSKECLDTEMDI